MNREDIIKLAREAGFDELDMWSVSDSIERFAALVAAAERNRTWTQEHWTEYERNIAAAAKAEENEACAKVCEQSDKDGEGPDCWDWHAKDYAAAIRARKENT